MTMYLGVLVDLPTSRTLGREPNDPNYRRLPIRLLPERADDFDHYVNAETLTWHTTVAWEPVVGMALYDGTGIQLMADKLPAPMRGIDARCFVTFPPGKVLIERSLGSMKTRTDDGGLPSATIVDADTEVTS